MGDFVAARFCGDIGGLKRRKLLIKKWRNKNLETIASNKRKSFEKLRVEGVNLAVEAGSPGSNDD